MATGCSPYDLARLGEEHPDVFDEYIDMVWDSIEQRSRMAEMEERKARVNRIFSRGR